MRRIALGVLLLLAFLPSAVFAHVAYRCRIDGQSRSACCCPATAKAKPARDAAPVSRMIARSCCEVSASTPADRPTADPPQVTNLQVPPATLVAFEVPAPSLDGLLRIAIASEALGPPPLERSLYASHIALLL